MLLEADVLYKAHVAAVHAFEWEATGVFISLPPWEELSWPEKDHWQELADELNEAERGTPDAQS